MAKEKEGRLVIDENTIYEVDMECENCRNFENKQNTNEKKGYETGKNYKENHFNRR